MKKNNTTLKDNAMTTWTVSRQLIGAVLPISMLLMANAASAAEVIEPGSDTFTEAQFEQGLTLYQDNCASCHGSQLDNGAAPTLKSATFRKSWSRIDVTVGDLQQRIATTMPPGAAGTLTQSQYLAVLAFVIGNNNILAGSDALVADYDYLSAIPLSRGDEVLDIQANFIVGDNGLTPSGSGPDFTALRNSASNASDWLYHNHNYQGTRHSPLKQITAANASQLQQRCAYQLYSSGSMQNGPVVYEGVMYLSDAVHTAAIDASDCEVLWSYDWEPKDRMVWGNNRGVSIKDGYVVRGTPDGFLLALDAANGNLLWARQVADPWLGETFTMPPMLYDDLILIGPAGSENAISGWVGAFTLSDGDLVWKFMTVPDAAAGGGETWGNPFNIPLGGGAVWTPLSLNPERNEVYAAVTNPAPDLPAYMRPGDNLYTNSLVALDPRSGELLWYKQMVPNDDHDWDLTQVSPVLSTSVNPVAQSLITTVGKDGYLRSVDSSSHAIVYEAEVTTIENHDIPVTTEGVRACPGVTGGVLWNGPAYYPQDNLLITPATDYCSTFIADEEVSYIPGQLYMGGATIQDDDSSGWLTAIDADTGERRWRYHSADPFLGAVTTTGGGLVIAGELDGYLNLFDASTGEIVHRLQTGAPIGGGVVTYEVDGQQYLAVSTGRPGLTFANASRQSSVVIYSLAK